MFARLLIIEDDPALARLLARHLERRGYAVETAATGADGRARVQSGGVDLVMLDQALPDANGLDLLAEIRAYPEAPEVVFVTGSDDARIAVAALKAGAADYVIKTVEREFPTLVEASVGTALRHQALLREKNRAVAELLAAREHAEALARQQALLLREVNHRVANSLQLIASVATMQERTAVHDDVRQALSDMRARVQAIASVHRRLYTSDDVQSVELDGYLRGLTEELSHSLLRNGRVSGIRLDSEPVRVPTDKAVAVGMIVAELVTNAIKYAYPEPQIGEIRIALKREAADAVSLAVSDDGVGYAPGEVASKGLGQRVIRAMTHDLGGQIEYGRVVRGTLTRLRFPAAFPKPVPV